MLLQEQRVGAERILIRMLLQEQRVGAERILIRMLLQLPAYLGLVCLQRCQKVQLLVGRDKGKIGEICEIVHERNWVFVEELHMKLETRGEPLGSRTMERVEMPLLVNEVKLIDPSDMRATDTEWRYTEEGQKVRVSARTGRIIPIPFSQECMWEDFVRSSNYKNSDHDTPDDELIKITFEPRLCTFEEDICESMDLKHEKRVERSFWY